MYNTHPDTPHAPKWREGLCDVVLCSVVANNNRHNTTTHHHHHHKHITTQHDTHTTQHDTPHSMTHKGRKEGVRTKFVCVSSHEDRGTTRGKHRTPTHNFSMSLGTETCIMMVPGKFVKTKHTDLPRVLEQDCHDHGLIAVG